MENDLEEKPGFKEGLCMSWACFWCSTLGPSILSFLNTPWLYGELSPSSRGGWELHGNEADPDVELPQSLLAAGPAGPAGLKGRVCHRNVSISLCSISSSDP